MTVQETDQIYLSGVASPVDTGLFYRLTIVSESSVAPLALLVPD